MVAAATPHPHRRIRTLVAAGPCCGVLLLLTGCEGLIDNDRYVLVWALAPFLGWLTAGGLFVYFRRARQLSRWNLLGQPVDPGVARIVSRLIWATFAAFLVFVAVNLYHGGMDWSLRLMNIGLWLLGSLVGSWLAAFLGLRLAENRLPSA